MGKMIRESLLALTGHHPAHRDAASGLVRRCTAHPLRRQSHNHMSTAWLSAHGIGMILQKRAVAAAATLLLPL